MAIVAYTYVGYGLILALVPFLRMRGNGLR